MENLNKIIYMYNRPRLSDKLKNDIQTFKFIKKYYMYPTNNMPNGTYNVSRCNNFILEYHYINENLNKKIHNIPRYGDVIDKMYLYANVIT